MNPRLILLSIGLSCISNFALAQEQANPGIFGLMNPRTGAFTPAPTAPSTSTTTKAINGTIKVSISASVASTLPNTVKTFCTALAQGFSPGSPTTPGSFYGFEQATTRATILGTSLSCTVKVPYLWHGDPTGGLIGISFAITAFDASDALAGQLRSTNQPIATIPLPPNGTTTTEMASTAF